MSPALLLGSLLLSAPPAPEVGPVDSNPVDSNPVEVRDFHATILHTLGLDHERLTYPFRGLDVKLTGVEKARVVRELLV